MSRRCKISGLSRQNGNRVSHARNRTKHVFQANLQKRTFFVPSLNRSVTLRVSTRMIRTIDKLGLEATLRRYGMSVKDLAA